MVKAWGGGDRVEEVNGEGMKGDICNTFNNKDTFFFKMR